MKTWNRGRVPTIARSACIPVIALLCTACTHYGGLPPDDPELPEEPIGGAGEPQDQPDDGGDTKPEDQAG